MCVEPGYAEIFGALTAASLRRVLSFVAQLHPQVVVRMLRCMSPRAGALIIRRFEEADLDPKLGRFAGYHCLEALPCPFPAARGNSRVQANRSFNRRC